ncbi:MAG: type II toxin-antitoxin system RatA family toxin [Acidimicrobiales bacterium]
MPRIEANLVVGVPVEVAFAVSQTQGEIRYRWDPFVRRQELLDGATRPARGVRTLTRSRHGLRMVSEYTAFRPPTQVGMRMVEGPWFFATFGGGWSFKPVDDGRTEVTWRYVFTVRPSALAPVADAIGRRLLSHDIKRRLAGYAKGCADPVVVAAAVGDTTNQAGPTSGQ